MIDKVAFSGRETMLTKGLEIAAEKIEPQVVRASSILPPLPAKSVETIIPKNIYSSPYAPIEVAEESVMPSINRCGLDIFA